MAFNIRKISIFHKYLLTNIIILIIPLAILGKILYTNSVVVLQKDIEEFAVSRVQSVQELVQKQLDQLESISAKIMFDRQMASYVVKKNEYYTRLAAENLLKYKNSSMLIDEVFLYFRGDSSIISSEGKMSLSTMSKSFFSFTESEYNAILSKINGLEKHETIGLADKMYNPVFKSQYILLLYPSYLTDEEQSAIIMFAVHKTTLVKFIEKAMGDMDSQIHILKNNGNNLEEIISMGNISTGKSLNLKYEDIKHISESLIDTGILDADINGENYSIVKVVSEKNNWQYLSVIPKAMLLKRVFHTRSEVLEAVIFVIVIGVFTAVLLSLFNYTPIKRLHKKVVGSIVKFGHDKCTNEIDEIELRLLTAVENNKILIKQVNFHQTLVRDQILMMLLKGDINDNDKIDELFPACKISFNNRFFRVVVISLGPAERKKSTSTDISFWLTAVLENNQFKDNVHITELMHDQIAILVNAGESEICKESFDSLAKEIVLLFKRKLDIDLFIGIGKAYDNLCRIKDSYLEALSSLDFQSINGGYPVTFFDDIMPAKNEHYWYPFQELSNIVQSLKQGNLNAFVDIFKGIRLNINSRRLSPGLANSVCFGVINSIIMLINDLNIDSLAEEIESVAQFNSMDDLTNKLEELADRICQFVNAAKGNSNQRLLESVMEYINKEYRSNMLSLETTAEEFGISPGYLSRFFKEQTGLKFVDYVKELRINEAKKLLVETEKVIKDIVGEIGYTDTANFIRTFRLSVGLTPGDYRKIYFMKG